MNHPPHKSEWIAITPEIAERWLDTKAPNRTLNENLVMEYALVMEKGGWESTHQGIAFDVKGRLVDGQHRMKALSLQRAGKALTFLVTRGLTDDEVLALDQGRQRDSADALSIYRGTPVSKHSVAIAKRVIHISPFYAAKAGKTAGSRWRIPTADLDMFLREHSAAMIRACELARRTQTTGLSSALMGSLLFRAYYHVPAARFNALLDVLATGHYDDRNADKAGLLLREHVMTRAEGYRGENLIDHYRMERAIKAFWKGENLVKIYPSSDELFPLPEEKGQTAPIPAVIRRLESARAERTRTGMETRKARAAATATAAN